MFRVEQLAPPTLDFVAFIKALALFGSVMQRCKSSLSKRILKAGRIEFGFGAIDCVVRNVSLTGASLEVESPVGITVPLPPPEHRLHAMVRYSAT